MTRFCPKRDSVTRKVIISTFLGMRWWFPMPFKSFPACYTNKNFVFASLNLLTNFENVYWDPCQNFLHCDWSMFSSVNTSLAAMKMRQKIYLSQVAVSMISQGHRRLPVCIFMQNPRFRIFELKGQCPEIFDFCFFSWISFPQASEYTTTAISNFFENSRLKVHHRCQRHRWQIEKIFFFFFLLNHKQPDITSWEG